MASGDTRLKPMAQKIAVVSIRFYFYSRRKSYYYFSVYFQVTGANKGIGYAIVNRLCSTFDGVIYLTGN